MVAFFVTQVILLFLFWTWLFGRRVGAALGLFLGSTWLAAYEGWLRFGPLPPPIFLLLVPATVTTILLARSRAVDRVGTGWLIGYQSFRVLVEIFLWWGHRDGVVPGQITWEGRNFDVLTGVSAPLMGWLAVHGKAPALLLHSWNLAGLALLINVVTVAALSMPTPFQRFHPANVFIVEPPFVWLPLFLVQSALFGHVALLRRIRQMGETR